MYRCMNCGRCFDEPEEIHTTYEAYYEAPLASYTPLTVYLCPFCHEEAYEEIEDEEDEEDK